MKHGHLPLWVLHVLALVALVGCSSSKKADDSDGATVSGLNRFMDKGFDRKSGQFDRGKVSEFDQSRYAASKKVKSDRFHTGSFAGKHDFTGSRSFKAKEFAQSDKVSREQTQAFGGAGKESREASQEYATKESRYGNQQSRQGEKRFGAEDKGFATRSVSDVVKAQEKNERPQMIPRDEGESGKPAYTESEVKRLINRN